MRDAQYDKRDPEPADGGSPDLLDGSESEVAMDTDLEVDPELEALMDRLRVIADQVDAPPSIVVQLAEAAFETRDLDAELAVLTADSDVDTLELVRSVAVAPRMVSFETDEVTIELQLDRLDDALTIRGLVVGAAGSIVIDTGDQRIGATLDERGWFVAHDVPAGALRLRFTATDGSHVTTAWITT